ncbi:dihydrodipicolinate synthase family protein [Sphingobacterium gobiense]|uniref:N-acetylneuraminate lyase n=1 Tax=Sphingobacterium gobiense TaxID=1382456 RepID=A0A2S9JUN7_9SPHI|nr:dihydrodipicolinate synthase family protein [Sphingobacterium gobiense]PRD56992.1 N-acetylneuraminate lyase [Sphingobacterium gobiense]
MKKVKGLIVATFAAYKSDGSVNFDIIPEITEHMVQQKVTGIFICGTNGEGPSLSTEERMQVAEAYMKAVRGRLRVFVHVGHSSVTEARRLAAHAEAIGADYISAVSAFYFKPSTVKNLIDSMAEIASAAPNTPFYYYHIPNITGIHVDMMKFLELAEQYIPTFAGIKYTASTINEYQACLHYKDGKYDILFGYDELLLPALAVGAQGAIGSTYNYAARLYIEVMNLFEQRKIKEAEQLHFHAVEMVQLIVKYGPIPTQRAIMKKIGLDLGNPRLPLQSLDTEAEHKLYEDLTASGFLELVNGL